MTYLMPPLNALRAFEAAARHLSFKLAAHELHVTPGAVSQQVKLLEDRPSMDGKVGLLSYECFVANRVSHVLDLTQP